MDFKCVCSEKEHIVNVSVMFSSIFLTFIGHSGLVFFFVYLYFLPQLDSNGPLVFHRNTQGPLQRPRVAPTAVWAHEERSFEKIQDHYLICDPAVMKSRSRYVPAVLVILGSLKVSFVLFFGKKMWILSFISPPADGSIMVKLYADINGTGRTGLAVLMLPLLLWWKWKDGT